MRELPCLEELVFLGNPLEEESSEEGVYTRKVNFREFSKHNPRLSTTFCHWKSWTVTLWSGSQMKKTKMMEKIARRALNLTKNSIMTRQPKRLSRPLYCDIFAFLTCFQIEGKLCTIQRLGKIQIKRAVTCWIRKILPRKKTFVFNSIQPAHVFVSFERMLVIEFLQSLLTDCDILIFATCAS